MDGCPIYVVERRVESVSVFFIYLSSSLATVKHATASPAAANRNFSLLT